MKMQSLHDLFILEVQDLYDAEQQIIEALPKLMDAAEGQKLKDAFEEHLEQTKEHASRLEVISKDLDFSLEGKGCKGMEGVIKEGQECLKMEEGPIRDLAIIGAAQRVEHYEIAGYGTARTLAEAMEHEDAVDLLQETGDEEGEADQNLTDIAEEIMSEIGEEEYE